MPLHMRCTAQEFHLFHLAAGYPLRVSTGSQQGFLFPDMFDLKQVTLKAKAQTLQSN